MSLDERLNTIYNEEECSAAIRGEKLPQALASPTTRLCITHGIRYHHGFATELYSQGKEYPEFTRALNARSIMSGIIPEMNEPHEFPYCIWHPDIANEATYRELAQKYPQMRYHVGRACAAGGYTELFSELDLLPEISIAEEARDNQDSGRAIFDAIMASPVKYAVMDDYERAVELNNPRAGACLNGDTAVRSSLDEKGWHVSYAHSDDMIRMGSYQPWRRMFYFDIAEDGHVDNDQSEDENAPDPEVVQYLYTPLPADLPHVNKDILIIHAAYEGNVDRYSRLRRPRMLNGEFQCVLRGIFHNTMFAKWWSLQPEAKARLQTRLRRAINARFIMNNDLSRITKDTLDDDLPYNIYYPSWPTSTTLEELLRLKPCMAPQIARVCIVTDRQSLYDDIKVYPDRFLLYEARYSSNPHYLADILRRAQELNVNLDDESDWPEWKIHSWQDRTEASKDWKFDYISFFNRDYTAEMAGDMPDQRGMYEGEYANLGYINHNVCLHKQ
ncbi:hypothetical protein V494_07071 [Pseudogymnoascus sp. VKM F-4513 (FW-928)]|nr:hypothetical protein V494_07071 [Pseudogymnoascus sp. VKM F-4513 (FW-928)]